jgi:GTPase
VEDDGYPRGLDSKELSASIGIIASMAASLAATARLVECVRGGFGRRAALMHIKANAEEGMNATDLRVAGGSVLCLLRCCAGGLRGGH